MRLRARPPGLSMPPNPPRNACARATRSISCGARSFHPLTSVTSCALGEDVSGAARGARCRAAPRTFRRFAPPEFCTIALARGRAPTRWDARRRRRRSPPPRGRRRARGPIRATTRRDPTTRVKMGGAAAYSAWSWFCSVASPHAEGTAPRASEMPTTSFASPPSPSSPASPPSPAARRGDEIARRVRQPRTPEADPKSSRRPPGGREAR